MTLMSIHRVLWLILLCLLGGSATAAPLGLGDRAAPVGQLGRHASYWVETAGPVDWRQAVSQQEAGAFLAGTDRVANFGIGAQPVWVHLPLENRSQQAIALHLLVGVTWLDHINVHVVQSGALLQSFHTGDEVVGTPGVVPVQGYGFPLQLPPGLLDVYIRVESVDPMVIPLELLSADDLNKRQTAQGYGYGLFYGFLAALCIYNLLLFAGLKERSYLYYSLGLVALALCNLGYTGHGIAWLWGDVPAFQRYVVLFLMVLYGALALLFAVRFLAVDDFAPRVARGLRWLAVGGLFLMMLAVSVESHTLAALLAFAFLLLCNVALLALGGTAVVQGRVYGHYFLAATVFGLLGIGVTDLAVWGKIEFSWFTFHAGEFGLATEATLLAMALAYKIRLYQQANQQAEEMARIDPLTGLFNRRAFEAFSAPLMGLVERKQRPLSLIMLDLDHFKQINDRHGHPAGDAVLVEAACSLRSHSRTSDVVARWGGEEFILLLPETGLEQAVLYAERLRKSIQGLEVRAEGVDIRLTASFGVAQAHGGESLTELVRRADAGLYRAKQDGRNRVCQAG